MPISRKILKLVCPSLGHTFHPSTFARLTVREKSTRLENQRLWQIVRKPPRSPLSSRTGVRHLASFPVAGLRKAWKEQFGIDISRELRGLKTVERYECQASGLRFYHPESAAGSADLYQQLASFDWYYMREKWEYEQALPFCHAGAKVLEVGSGAGEFLKRLRTRGVDGYGLEINSASRKKCLQDGLKVHTIKLSGLRTSSFDIVCAFQVLEHVPQPLEFLRECVRILRPGGRLILATPNTGSSLLEKPVLLDMPPHHLTGWQDQTYRFLETLLPLQLLECRKEPLAVEHLDFWIGTVRQNGPARFFWRVMPKKALRFLLRWGGRRLILGQGILVIFRKKGRLSGQKGPHKPDGRS